MSKDNDVKLLSGGNPQIPKGYGNSPVENYIAAMPDWKRKIGRRLDDLIEKAVPDVTKAVKWNSPFYGTQKDVWFLSYHCFTKYVKVTFFDGASLDPPPPESSKQEKVRYLNIHEEDDFDEERFVDWVRQASKLPGEKL
ncbi:DUF1801 domain-containing protein [Primorskyibacter flagellatus]|uniref:YdhG-like domain-containing protein n=1 Tax=Primorskyibacter flagellatus TaxID=1387277 RepID=A0A1W2C5W3_9RHOB|nr:DUF1801 domain-containing protein [Primorskyibacter flagellatus]SMC80262.1 hypothetical protein SAMN06295998_10635 [Primorskyibacter flagellatus]